VGGRVRGRGRVRAHIHNMLVTISMEC